LEVVGGLDECANIEIGRYRLKRGPRARRRHFAESCSSFTIALSRWGPAVDYCDLLRRKAFDTRGTQEHPVCGQNNCAKERRCPTIANVNKSRESGALRKVKGRRLTRLGSSSSVILAR
jgi:hypothetical protein